MSDSIKIIKATNRREYAAAIQVRTVVFVIGQNVPATREVDQYEDQCNHFIALDTAGQAVGAVRWRFSDGVAKIERLAVLEQARGQKIGEKLMQAVIDDIKSDARPIATAKLGAQDYIIPFYERLGFVVEGDGFEDGGGIPHHMMSKKIA